MSNEELLAQVAALGGPTLLVVLVALIALLVLLLVPTFLVAFSRQVRGSRKLVWVVAMLSFSWLAWPAWRAMLRRTERARQQGGSA
ncbi:MAG TPA: hypothetical protein VF816_12425 [Rhodocyclaceae bacterium]